MLKVNICFAYFGCKIQCDRLLLQLAGVDFEEADVGEGITEGSREGEGKIHSISPKS